MKPPLPRFSSPPRSATKMKPPTQMRTIRTLHTAVVALPADVHGIFSWWRTPCAGELAIVTN